MKDPHRYDHMLYMPHHQSKIHPQMSRHNRAAQFSPFAALTGFDRSIEETARQTDRKIELDENMKAILDEKLIFLYENLNSSPEVEFTYFEADKLKSGGSYRSVSGLVKKIDLNKHEITIRLSSPEESLFILKTDDIYDINSEFFDIIYDYIL